MYWEYVEEKLSAVPEKNFEYIPGSGDYLTEKAVALDRQSLIDAFKNVDLSSLDDK